MPKTYWTLMLLLGVAVGCGSDTDTDKTNNDSGSDTATPQGKFEDCILSTASGDIPETLHSSSGIHETTTHGNFQKHILVNGITLVAKNDVSDSFLLNVAQTITELLPDYDSPEQAAVLEKLYAYKATIPVFAGGENGVDIEAIESIENQASICDIIMQDVEYGQAMEVLEHLLHHATNVGLNKAMPDAWGLSADSALFEVMQQAIDDGIYGIRDYEEIPEENIRNRVLLQEFSYWIITSYWDLQTRYGPEPSSEWTARTTAELQEKLPDAYNLVNSLLPVMRPPQTQTLDRFSDWEGK